MSNLPDLAAIIDRWPNVTVFAAEVGVGFLTANSWRSRGLRNAEHFPSIVRAAQARGFTDVTVELLVLIAERTGRERKEARRRAKLAEKATPEEPRPFAA